MLRCGTAFLLLVCSAFAADDKGKYKGPEIEIAHAKAHRSEGLIAVDVRVRNCGVRPLTGLTLLFDFMAPGKAVITTQKIGIEEEILEPGQESTLHVQLNDPVRAVSFRFQAVDGDARDLRVAKPGPYPIE